MNANNVTAEKKKLKNNRKKIIEEKSLCFPDACVNINLMHKYIRKGKVPLFNCDRAQFQILLLKKAEKKRRSITRQ